MAGTPGPERIESARGSHIVGCLLSRPVHVPELLPCVLRPAIQVHNLCPRPPLDGVAVPGPLPLCNPALIRTYVRCPRSGVGTEGDSDS
jgi:hypothetical protein